MFTTCLSHVIGIAFQASRFAAIKYWRDILKRCDTDGILGLVLATIAGTTLSVFVLIGSQSMNDKTLVLPIIAAYFPMLALAHGARVATSRVPNRR